MSAEGKKEKVWDKKTQTVFVKVVLHYERKKNHLGIETIQKSATISSEYEPKITPLNPHVRGYGVEPHEKDAAMVPVTMQTAMRAAGFDAVLKDKETSAAVAVANKAPMPAPKQPPMAPNPDGSRG